MLKTISLIGIVAFLCSCNSSSQTTDKKTKDTVAAAYVPPKPSLSPQEFEHYSNLSRNFIEKYLPARSFNGGVLIAKNGVVVYERYTGFVNLRTKDSLTADTPLQIASTSKTFTSGAILQLVQQGKLDLNTPVIQFFPGFPYPEVTVKMLLDHRSGVPEYLYFFEKNNWPRYQPASNNDVINALATWQPGRAYRPDVHFNYCNTNYVLLASIVEKISGMSFPDYMKTHIFDPLQMTNTYVKTRLDSARATPSFNWNGTLWAHDFSDGTYGDKNIFSTPRDLLKWDQALYTSQMVTQPLLDSAFTPRSNERKSTHNYGYGWRMLFYPNGKKVIYHNGKWHGFNSAFARLTDEKVTIIMLSSKLNKSVYTVSRKMYGLFGNYDKEHAGELE